MSAYADASALVSLFVPDTHSPRIDRFLRSHRILLLISDFAVAEFSSAILLRVRRQNLTHEQANAVLLKFDQWREQEAQSVDTIHADMVVATALLRRFDLKLRTPDALNLAIAQRVAVRLLTFDVTMADAARALGVEVVAA